MWFSGAVYCSCNPLMWLPLSASVTHTCSRSCVLLLHAHGLHLEHSDWSAGRMRMGLLIHAQTARAEDVKAADVTSCFASEDRGDEQTPANTWKTQKIPWHLITACLCVFRGLQRNIHLNTPHSLSCDISASALSVSPPAVGQIISLLRQACMWRSERHLTF